MKTILFVEDEYALQKTFGDILEKEGYKMVLVSDGESGLRLARSIKPDLILLDLILPKMHGLAVLEQLKKDAETQNIPVVILTNLEGMEEINKALELGAKAYLIKTNYGLKEVIEKIKKAL